MSLRLIAPPTEALLVLAVTLPASQSAPPVLKALTLRLSAMRVLPDLSAPALLLRRAAAAVAKPAPASSSPAAAPAAAGSTSVLLPALTFRSPERSTSVLARLAV